MSRKDPKVDAYIEKSADFARPILNHLRKVVHAACPEVEEEIKWGMPFFLHNGLLCNMAAFKEHCAFGFWKARQIQGERSAGSENKAMGAFGRITKLSDLPSEKALAGFIRKAMKLNDEGAKVAPRRARRAGLKTPAYFMDALRRNKKALSAFENLSISHKREYVEWVVGAKTEETRKRRLETTIEWMAEGKSRNWKYDKK